MKLPSWTTLKKNYPAHEAGKVFRDIGGKVELNYDIGVFSNACATRVSVALNGSGQAHEIHYFKDKSPNGNHESQVSSGENNKWYIFRVKMLVKYLSHKYGEPKTYSASEYASKLFGKKGIIVFEVSGWSDATGHADLWNGSKCLWKGYGGMANKILFWEASS